MSRFEDRLWSDLVANHGVELVRATEAAPNRGAFGPVAIVEWIRSLPRSRRALAIGGGAILLVGGGAGALAISHSFSSNVQEVITSVPPGKRIPPPTIPQQLEMGAIVAHAKIDGISLILAPQAKLTGPLSRFDLSRPGSLCFAVMQTETSGGVTCGLGSGFATQGAMEEWSLRPSNTLWGVVPVGTVAVTADGRPVRLVGRFFETTLPSHESAVTLTTRSGREVILRSSGGE